jgi:hypothetical protein
MRPPYPHQSEFDAKPSHAHPPTEILSQGCIDLSPGQTRIASHPHYPTSNYAMITYKQVYYCGQIGGEMNSKAEIQSSNHAYAIYKIKRLAKILVVCAGIVVTLASFVASLSSLSVFVSSKSELFIKKQGGGVGGCSRVGMTSNRALQQESFLFIKL